MQGARDGRVDLYRGLALVFIFWDHVPGSVLGLVSMRNFGLSDAAEVFVFLAGYSAAMAYGGVMARHGFVPAAVRVLKRGWTPGWRHAISSRRCISAISSSTPNRRSSTP
jgi:hypothetical protein